jgi:glutathione peroxidase
MSSINDFQANDIAGNLQELSQYKGKVLLVVNTASQCGFTPQYKGLQALYEHHEKKGFAVLGFPCNQFGAQEKGNSEEIEQFCELNFGVTFPMFEKIEVNGPNTHPLYDWMKSKQKGLLGSKNIKWNFTKFLINREGEVVKRYSPTTKPEQIEKDILRLL